MQGCFFLTSTFIEHIRRDGDFSGAIRTYRDLMLPGGHIASPCSGNSTS
jgi:hypothetical protein